MLFERVDVMKERVNNWLNILMGTVFGVFLGYGIFVYWEYQNRPELYALSSTPWYSSILLYGAYTVGILLVLALIKWFLKKK